MKTLKGVVACILLSLIMGLQAGAEEKALFGPVKYDVKDRYGKLNRYSADFPAKDGVYVVKLQVGAAANEKPDWLEFSVNGEKAVISDKYAYPLIAVFVKLKKENTIEVVMRDDYPTSLRRPPPTPKNVLVTVLPITTAGHERLRGSFGLLDWNQQNEYMAVMLKISGAASSLAMESVSVQSEVTRRAEMFRKLADMKERSAESFFERVFGDMMMPAELRAEAALALGSLGDKKFIPLLMIGFVDPEEPVSVASARALSRYPEKDTQELLTKTLEKLDYLRKDAAIRTIVNAEWKPVSTIAGLADSADPHISEVALAVLGGMRTSRATDYLLAALENPGKRQVRTIIHALSDTKDPRAADALLSVASDKTKRAGREIDLGNALVKTGDQRAAAVIQDLVKHAPTSDMKEQLRAAYQKLTGKEL